MSAEPLVSVGLPVRNGAAVIAPVIESVLAQSHERLELVICDNASTDDTETVCRDIAARDERVVYRRHPRNIGLFNNFVSTMAVARGTYYRWIGDDDWMAPTYVARCLDRFAAEDGLLLVTTGIGYTDVAGRRRVDDSYTGESMRDPDPVVRLRAILTQLNATTMTVDPLYGMLRRDVVVSMARRNMLREDELFATRLALAGPWGHVPEVLAERNTRDQRLSDVARVLDVPPWQVWASNTLLVRQMLRSAERQGLDDEHRAEAGRAVRAFYRRRQAVSWHRRASRLRSLVPLPGRIAGDRPASS